MSTYSTALDYLNQFINYERSQPARYTPETLNLDRVNQLLDRLGRPDRQFRSIHIAGTKGKGSTAAMIESTLRANGYCTGLYTSPHLHTFRERIRIKGDPITEEDFVPVFNQIKLAATEVAGITWFEFITALAFLTFAQANIDIGVIEVGLGGRFDATNVITPIVSVITSLSLDHMNLLGNTIEQIAFEKAGIIKPMIPVISSPQVPAALEVLERIAQERQAPLTLVGREVTYELIVSSHDGQEFTLKNQAGTGPSYKIPLLGAHQISNAATAITALHVAEQFGLPITDKAIARGLANVKWPGRLEILNRDPLLVVDGAHNADSAQKLALSLRDIFGDQAWTLIIGISADKDIPAILTALVLIASQVIVTHAHNVRATDVAALAEQVKQHGVTPVMSSSVAEAIEIGLNYHAAIIVTGSIFTVADAREAWLSRSGLPLPEKDE